MASVRQAATSGFLRFSRPCQAATFAGIQLRGFSGFCAHPGRVRDGERIGNCLSTAGNPHRRVLDGEYCLFLRQTPPVPRRHVRLPQIEGGQDFRHWW